MFGHNRREDYVILNYLHSQIMQSTGRPWGQRDPEVTRSALARPFRTAFNQEIYGDIYEKAAALLDAIVNRVVFRDGNKRTALAAAALYLGLQGRVFRFDSPEVERFMRHVVLDHPDISEIALWLRRSSRPKVNMAAVTA